MFGHPTRNADMGTSRVPIALERRSLDPAALELLTACPLLSLSETDISLSEYFTKCVDNPRNEGKQILSLFIFNRANVNVKNRSCLF